MNGRLVVMNGQFVISTGSTAVRSAMIEPSSTGTGGGLAQQRQAPCRCWGEPSIPGPRLQTPGGGMRQGDWGGPPGRTQAEWSQSGLPVCRSGLVRSPGQGRRCSRPGAHLHASQATWSQSRAAAGQPRQRPHRAPGLTPMPGRCGRHGGWTGSKLGSGDGLGEQLPHLDSIPPG